jgi:serine/threonine-protein kinase RsbW
MRDSTRESGGDEGVEQPQDRVRELEDRIEREASVAELGRRALTGTTADELLRLAVAEVVRMLGTARGAVLMTDGKGLDCAVSAGWPEDEIEPTPLTKASHAGYVCLASEVSVVEDLVTDDRFPASRHLTGLGIRSAAAVPIRGGTDRALGVLAVHDVEPREYVAADVFYLRAVANTLAAAIARESAQTALTRLQETTALLAEARTPREIGEVIVSSGAASVGAAGGWVADVSQGGDSLELLASFGFDDSRIEEFRTIPLEQRNPTTDAIAEGSPLYFHSAEQVRDAYPDVPYSRYEAMAVVPVMAGADAIGVLALTFAETRAFEPAERGTIDALAKLFGQSLERSKLYEDARRREWAASLVARLSESLERATSVPERCRRAVSILAAELAGFAAIDLRAEDGTLQRVASSRRDSWPVPDPGSGERLSAAALATGRAQSTDLPRREGGPAAQLHALPLRARQRTAGTLIVATVAGRREDALGQEWLRELADHVALGIDNAQLYEREQNASRTLQLGLLGGELPQPEGAALVAAYRPGTVTNEVGGDWYDAFPLEVGRLAILVGDVVGHDLEAAVAMGQLRGAVRALASLGSPAALLERLDSFVSQLRGGAMTTMAYAELDIATGDLRYACAGHPPPLSISADGKPRFLWGGRSGPLGIDMPSRPEEHDRLEPGATLVLYTDGLIERKGESLAVGLERLGEAARAASGDGLQPLVDRMLSAMLAGHPQEDDVCVIAGCLES